jgi:hypothetical protein
MGALQKRVDQVFVLRLWREEDPHVDGPSLWRARISEVNTGREFHAEGLETALTILRSLVMKEGRDRS